MKSRIWVVFCLILFFACTEKTPKSVLPSDKFEAIYIALLEEGGSARVFHSDSTRQAKVDSIFHSFGTSEDAFRVSIDAYRANPEKWKEFFEGVTNKLEEKQKAMQKKVRTDSARSTPE